VPPATLRNGGDTDDANTKKRCLTPFSFLEVTPAMRVLAAMESMRNG